MSDIRKLLESIDAIVDGEPVQAGPVIKKPKSKEKFLGKPYRRMEEEKDEDKLAEALTAQYEDYVKNKAVPDSKAQLTLVQKDGAWAVKNEKGEEVCHGSRTDCNDYISKKKSSLNDAKLDEAGEQWVVYRSPTDFKKFGSYKAAVAFHNKWRDRGYKVASAAWFYDNMKSADGQVAEATGTVSPVVVEIRKWLKANGYPNQLQHKKTMSVIKTHGMDDAAKNFVSSTLIKASIPFDIKDNKIESVRGGYTNTLIRMKLAQGVTEGIGDTIKRGVKSVKRGMQGWSFPTTDLDRKNGGPRGIVNRNKGYDDETVKSLSDFKKRVAKVRPDSPHSPSGLQQRVLDREIKKRGLGEEGIGGGTDKVNDLVRKQLAAGKRVIVSLGNKGGYIQAEVPGKGYFVYGSGRSKFHIPLFSDAKHKIIKDADRLHVLEKNVWTAQKNLGEESHIGQPNTDSILEYLTTAYRRLQRYADAYQDFSVITRVYDNLRMELMQGDYEGFEKEYDHCLRRFPDAATELFDAMFVEAGLPEEQGTIEQFMAKVSEGVMDEARVPQLAPGGADYSKYDTEHLKSMLRPGIMHRNEQKFKTLIRRELRKREGGAAAVTEGYAMDDIATGKPVKEAMAVKAKPSPEKLAKMRDMLDRLSTQLTQTRQQIRSSAKPVDEDTPQAVPGMQTNMPPKPVVQTANPQQQTAPAPGQATVPSQQAPAPAGTPTVPPKPGQPAAPAAGQPGGAPVAPPGTPAPVSGSAANAATTPGDQVKNLVQSLSQDPAAAKQLGLKLNSMR